MSMRKRGLTQQYNAKNLETMSLINGSPETIRSLTESLTGALSLRSYTGAIFPTLMRDGLDRLSKITAAEARYRSSEKEKAVAPHPVLDEETHSASASGSSTPISVPKGLYGRKRSPTKASSVSVHLKLPPTDAVVDGEEGTLAIHEIVTFVKRPQLSEDTRAGMRKRREYHAMSSWMRDGYSLDPELKKLVEEHRNRLRDIIAGYPESKYVEQRRRKFEFLRRIIEKSDLEILSPKELHELSKYKQDLLFKSTGRSYTHQLWLMIRKDIHDQLWKRACKLSDTESDNASSFFRIVNTVLIQKLYEKINSIRKPVNPDFSKVPDTNRDKWRHDKYYALDTIRTLHEICKLAPKNFDGDQEKYKCLAGRSFSFAKSSATEQLINDIEKEVRHLLWIEASGEGDDLRTEYLSKQGERATPGAPSKPKNTVPVL